MSYHYTNLHCHSNRSDGNFDIPSLVAMCDQLGIGALAITDHDTLCPPNLEEFEQAGQGRVKLIRGSELSASYTSPTTNKTITVHILALFYQKNPSALCDITQYNKSLSNEYHIKEILKKLDGCQMGICSYEELTKKCGCRPEKIDVAKELSAQKGIPIEEVYQVYLSGHGERRAYVPSEIRYAPMPLVVSAIIQDRGLPILAHPCNYRLTEEELEELVSEFKRAVGEQIAGIETWYSRYPEERREHNQRLIQQLASRYSLLCSAGDDFHGNAKSDYLHREFPISIYEALKRAHEQAYPMSEETHASLLGDISPDSLTFHSPDSMHQSF